MRIITGDECGLLKEVIPELSRPLTDGGAAAIHAGKARPSATSIQAAAAAQIASSSPSSAVQRIEEDGRRQQSRERGVISMAFIPPTPLDNDAGASPFRFATLRMDGVVQLWSGSRSCEEEESHVSPATYKPIGLCQNVFRDFTTAINRNSGGRDVEGGDADGENDVSSSFVPVVDNININNKSSRRTTSWNTHRPVRPIAMVSSYKHDTSRAAANDNFHNSNNPILACADSMGNISILNSHKLLERGVNGGAGVQSFNAFGLSNNNNNSAKILTYTKGQYNNTSICTAIELIHSGTKLAVGGRERPIRLLDIEQHGKLIWKAKNLPPHPQTLLQHPQWTTCIQSIYYNNHHAADNDTSTSVTNLLATGTAYKQVQIYDIRTSSNTRRPALYTPENLFQHRITSLCQLHNSNYNSNNDNTNNTTTADANISGGNILAIGDSIGDCHLIDMRKMRSGKQQYSSYHRNNKQQQQHSKEDIMLGRLVGPGGSIRELVMHPTLPLLACVGLDRKLWTWDVNKRKMLDCIYLKQRLNCALFCGDYESSFWNNGSDGGGDKDVGEEVPVDYDVVQRERELEEDEDEVEDYVDSEDDDDDGGGGWENGQDSGEETASDSEEGNDNYDDAHDNSSSSSEEEEEEDDDEPTHWAKRGKKQKFR